MAKKLDEEEDSEGKGPSGPLPPIIVFVVPDAQGKSFSHASR